jgi:hypothetical protein
LISFQNKFRVDFNTLYFTGKWTGLPVYRENTFEFSEHSNKVVKREEDFSYSRSSFYNRDDIPIRPLQMNYDEVQSENIKLTTPEPKFSNFLKRNKQNFNKPQEDKFIEKEVYEEYPLENIEESRQDDLKSNAKPKEFLKRKSRSVRPQKLEWKVKKRIDCWLPREKYPKPKDPIFEIRQLIPRGNYLTLKDIENEFQRDLNNCQELGEFFIRSESNESKIPQLNNQSLCVMEYSEEKYQKMIEELEKHYNYLCSEEVLTN